MRPDASVLVATYNQEGFIEESLRSVLAQESEPVEILVSDDRSTDNTWSIIEAVAADYSGPHLLRVHRQRENLGALGNNRWLRQHAVGSWLITNDGDDRSLPGRVAQLLTAGRRSGAALVCSNAMLLDAEGNATGRYLPDTEERRFGLQEVAAAGYQDHMLGATTMFRKQLLTEFGYFQAERIAGGGGDHVLPFRAGFFGGTLFLPTPLLAYRQHSAQMTRTICDRTSSQDVLAETYYAYVIKTTVHMWEDCNLYIQSHPDDPRGPKVRNLLMRKVLGLTKGWTGIRTALLARGLRPTWVERSVLDQRSVGDAFAPLQPHADPSTDPEGQ